MTHVPRILGSWRRSELRTNNLCPKGGPQPQPCSTFVWAASSVRLEILRRPDTKLAIGHSLPPRIQGANCTRVALRGTVPLRLSYNTLSQQYCPRAGERKNEAVRKVYTPAELHLAIRGQDWDPSVTESRLTLKGHIYAIL